MTKSTACAFALAASLAFCLPNPSAAQENANATLTGTSVDVPFMQLGNDYFALTFDLLTQPERISIQLRNFTQLDSPPSGKVNVFDAATNTLKLPVIDVGEADYWADFKLTASEPVTLDLTRGEQLFVPILPELDSPVTWDNIVERVDELGSIIYTDTFATIARNKLIPDYKVPYVIYRSPNLDAKHYGDIDIWLDDLFAYYGNSHRPDNEIFFIFPYEDLEWAIEQLSIPEVNFPGYESIMRGANPAPGQEGFRQNLMPSPAETIYGIWSLGTSLKIGNAVPTVSQAEQAMVVHEYGHQAQQAQWWKEDLNGPNRGLGWNTPCWLIEGVVSGPEMILIHNTLEAFLFNRSQRNLYLTPPLGDPLANRTNGGQFTDDLTSAYIENYLNESSVIMAGCTNSLYYGLGYSLGYFAVEALSAIKGVESSMALLERLGLGQDFELAFKDVYDIEWDAAVPILARVIEITAADSPR
jgi:hypothetical protein